MVLVVKNTPANAGDLGLIPGLGRSPGEGNGYTLQCSGLRILGHKELDMTELRPLLLLINTLDFPGGASGEEPA